jgi:uncharacterized integral membrane protein
LACRENLYFLFAGSLSELVYDGKNGLVFNNADELALHLCVKLLFWGHISCAHCYLDGFRRIPQFYTANGLALLFSIKQSGVVVVFLVR